MFILLVPLDFDDGHDVIFTIPRFVLPLRSKILITFKTLSMVYVCFCFVGFKSAEVHES